MKSKWQDKPLYPKLFFSKKQKKYEIHIPLNMSSLKYARKRTNQIIHLMQSFLPKINKIDRRSRHNHSYSKTYITWESMISRTKMGNVTNRGNYKNIAVCNRWKVFDNFLADMGERPEDKTLDRINNNKGYYKANCRWATRSEQQRNRLCNHLITINKRTKCLTEWCEFYGLKVNTVINRVNRGATYKQAFTENRPNWLAKTKFQKQEEKQKNGKL